MSKTMKEPDTEWRLIAQQKGWTADTTYHNPQSEILKQREHIGVEYLPVDCQRGIAPQGYSRWLESMNNHPEFILKVLILIG